MAQPNSSLLRRFASAVSIAAIATLASLPALAQTTPSDNAPASTNETMMAPTDGADATVSPLDREFVTLAYQGNNAEILTSQLALERSQDEEVRQYAQRMIDEHIPANQELTNYASQLNIALPSETVDPLNQAIADQLNQLSGDEFDQAYMSAQTSAHLRTIALYQTELAQGQAAPLETYVSQFLPDVEEHYQMASAMLPRYAVDPRPNMEVQPLQ